MLKLAEIFQSGMVLQRQKPVYIWGTANSGETVSVTLKTEDQAKKEIEVSASADKYGNWRVELPAMEAAESVSLKIYSKDQQESILLSDVAFGEVWLAGGQSNMEFWMRYEKYKDEALADCSNPRVRFFDVPKVCYDGQRDDFAYSRVGVWRKADPDNLDYFSAVGYYFEKEIERDLDVPVGIIGCNWGGTTSSVWMSEATVERVGKPWILEFKNKTKDLDMQKYWKEQRHNPINDKGNIFDPFSEMVLPGTVSQDEVMKFFGGLMEKAKEAGKKDAIQMYQEMVPAQTFPGCLYEHMLKTVAPFSIRGFLFYQGESDDDAPGMNILYKDMLTGLIGDWRALWHEELPFLFIQLPGYESWMKLTPKNHYPVIRQCQQEVADTVKGTYLCSISDVGEEFDIHPKDKKTVGIRLSLLARHYVYGEDVICDAPRAESAQRDGDTIVITFAHAGKGLVIEGEKLNAMQVEADGQEIDFVANTDGNRLILVLSHKPEEKLKLSFANTSWYQVNLYNDAHIPAVPFVLYA